MINEKREKNIPEMCWHCVDYFYFYFKLENDNSL